MNCPSCTTPVVVSKVVDGKEHCSACGHAWRVGASASSGNSGLRSLLMAPSGVYAEGHPGRVLEITIPWSHLAGPWIHVFLVVGLFPVGMFIFTGDVGARVYELPFAFAFFALWVYNVVNRTVILVGPKRLAVTHGPIPGLFDRNVELDARQIHHLSVQESYTHYRGNTATFYSLNSGSKVLLRKFQSEEVAVYVKRCIEEIMSRP